MHQRSQLSCRHQRDSNTAHEVLGSLLCPTKQRLEPTQKRDKSQAAKSCRLWWRETVKEHLELWKQ